MYLQLALKSIAFISEDSPFEIKLIIFCLEVLGWFHENYHKA